MAGDGVKAGGRLRWQPDTSYIGILQDFHVVYREKGSPWRGMALKPGGA